MGNYILPCQRKQTPAVKGTPSLRWRLFGACTVVATATSGRRLWQKVGVLSFLARVGCGLIFATKMGFGSCEHKWLSTYPPNKHLSSIIRSVTTLWVLLICLYFEMIWKAGLKFTTLLPQPRGCWDYMHHHAPPAECGLLCFLPWLVQIPGSVDSGQAAFLLHFLQFSESAHDSLSTWLRSLASSFLSLSPFSFHWLVWSNRNRTLVCQSLHCSRCRTFQIVLSLWYSLKFLSSGGRHSKIFFWLSG